MLKFTHKINYLLIFLTINGLTVAQSKQYDIYLYDSIKGMTLSIDSTTLTVKTLNFGKFLIEDDLEFVDQNLERKKNLIRV